MLASAQLSSWKSWDSFQNLSLSFHRGTLKLNSGHRVCVTSMFTDWAAPASMHSYLLILISSKVMQTGLNLKLSTLTNPGRAQLKGFPQKEPWAQVFLPLSPTEIFEPYTVFHSYTGINGKPQKWRLPLRSSSNCSGSKEITQNCYSWMRLTTLRVCYLGNSQAQPIFQICEGHEYVRVCVLRTHHTSSLQRQILALLFSAFNQVF